MIKKYLEKYREIIAYIIIGGMTTVVGLASYYILTWLFLDPMDPIELQIANVISWVLAVTFAYITNRMIVFRSQNKEVLKEAVSFYLARVATLIIEMTLMFLLVTVLKGNDKIMKLLVQISNIVLNYVFSKLWVFRKNRKNK